MSAPRDLDHLRRRLSALIDGEIGADEAAEWRRAIEDDPEVREEYEALCLLKSELKTAMEPPAVSEQEWDALFLAAFSRGSERFGWFLLVPGFISLLVGTMAAFFAAETIPLWLRISCGAMIAGLTFLGLAVGGERLRARRNERYDEVNR